MLGVDRLDMIKGIPQKILAFEKFLEENHEWNDKVVLLQIAVPTRTDVPECMSPSCVLSPIYTLCDSTSMSAGVPQMHEVWLLHVNELSIFISLQSSFLKKNILLKIWTKLQFNNFVIDYGFNKSYLWDHIRWEWLILSTYPFENGAEVL